MPLFNFLPQFKDLAVFISLISAFAFNCSILCIKRLVFNR